MPIYSLLLTSHEIVIYDKYNGIYKKIRHNNFDETINTISQGN